MPNVLEKLMVVEQLAERQHLFRLRNFNAEALKVSIFIGGIVSTHSNMVNGPEGNYFIEF